ncbi:hypothetical protein C4J94_1950 [Pseudomonas sp. R5-89-07]|nr:hypothetical protein C4J94_1950 [Pseudomonas sp. R5-89-07]
MSFTGTFDKRDLMSICVAQSICATGRTTDSYKDNFIVMTNESLSVSAGFNVVKKMYTLRMLTRRLIALIQKRIKGQNLKATGVGDVFIQWIKPLNLI